MRHLTLGLVLCALTTSVALAPAASATNYSICDPEAVVCFSQYAFSSGDPTCEEPGFSIGGNDVTVYRPGVIVARAGGSSFCYADEDSASSYRGVYVAAGAAETYTNVVWYEGTYWDPASSEHYCAMEAEHDNAATGTVYVTPTSLGFEDDCPLGGPPDPGWGMLVP